MLAYNELDKLLNGVYAQAHPAECHGFLCGQVCTSSTTEDDLWREFLDVQTDDNLLIEECYNEIQLLMANIVEEIQSGDFDFQLLLPDDEASLVQRVDALGEWCYGFLNGFGVGEGAAIRPLSDECREVLEDMSKISQITVEEDTDEADETALMELVEYVRVGAMMIFEEFHPEILQNGNPEVLH